MSKYRLIIDENRVTLWSDTGYGLTQATASFFGNIVSLLEDTFCDVAQRYENGDSLSNYIVERTLQKLLEDTNNIQIWGFTDGDTTLWEIYDFIAQRDFFYPTLAEIESLRISHRIRFAPLPFMNGELQFDNLSSVFQVVYSVLYYYSYMGYGLKRCKLCGKWFAFKKENARSEFCDRRFSYIDALGKKLEYPTCKDAREKIAARAKRRRDTIYNRLYSREGFTGKLNDFVKKADELHNSIKENPSISNLSKYEYFLYIECDELYPRYGRQK